MKKLAQYGTIAILIAFVMVSSASADIIIYPGTQQNWTGNDPQNPKAGDVSTITGYAGVLTEYYKNDYDGGDSGPFASSYNTAYSGDPNNATITYVGGAYISGSPTYLLVKGGAAAIIEPSWYLFNLSNIQQGDNFVAWNGTETIRLEDFWADRQGSISHVSLYGNGNGHKVPEPGTLLLLGSGLLALGFGRRWFRS